MPKPTHAPRTLISTRTFMERFDFKSISEVQRKAKAGRIPGAAKVDGRWRFDPDVYLESVTGAPPRRGRRMTIGRGRS